jgi:pimeloyl-ACP methyl ester carboxylesterase
MNVIVVDWGSLSGNTALPIYAVGSLLSLVTYPLVIQNVPITASRVSQFINFINVDKSATTVIGHSLGAHVGTHAIPVHAS